MHLRSRRFPNGRMHEDGGIDSHHIFIQQNHAVPPVFFDVVFQLYAHLTVVIHGAQTIIDFTRREYKPVFFTM